MWESPYGGYILGIHNFLRLRKLAECWGPGSMGWPPLVSCIRILSQHGHVPPTEFPLNPVPPSLNPPWLHHHYLLPPSGVKEVDSHSKARHLILCFWVLLSPSVWAATKAALEQRDWRMGGRLHGKTAGQKETNQMVQKCILLPYTSVLFSFTWGFCHLLTTEDSS